MSEVTSGGFVKRFGDDDEDDLTGYAPIPFEVVGKTDDGQTEVYSFQAVGMVPFSTIALDDTLRPTIRAWWDEVLLSDDGKDELPEHPDPDEQLDALNSLDPSDLSSRARWGWLWGEQDRVTVKGSHYGAAFEYVYAEYQDRHGIERVPTEQSDRSSRRRTGRTGSGSRGRRH